MPTRPTVAALAIFGIFCISVGQAEEPTTPGGIKLLPGYKHEKMKGKDTRVGKVWKEGGLSFQYDIGRGAGNAAKAQEKSNILWFKEQVVQGRTVHLTLTKDRTLYVTFPHTSANFYGKAKSEEALVDMLLMVLTYAPPTKPR